MKHGTQVSKKDLGALGGEFGIKTHQQTHHRIIELRRDVLYHKEMTPKDVSSLFSTGTSGKMNIREVRVVKCMRADEETTKNTKLRCIGKKRDTKRAQEHNQKEVSKQSIYNLD